MAQQVVIRKKILWQTIEPVNSQQFLQWCFDPFRHKPLIMGVLNITPNSFSDGGRYQNIQNACERALDMVQQGADLIDIGGEASNPYGHYESISVDEELSRVLPVIAAIREKSDVCISIDTCKAPVMEQAIAAGAIMINDINALQGDNALETASRLGVPVCLMHMQGNPKTMQDAPHYQDGVVNDINHFFSERIETCLKAGISANHLFLDPGIGFGKSTSHNLNILNQLSAFNQHQLPVLLGVSRKGFIGQILNKDVAERMIGGISIAVYAAMQGVKIIRTHDVDETSQALRMLDAISRVVNK